MDDGMGYTHVWKPPNDLGFGFTYGCGTWKDYPQHCHRSLGNMIIKPHRILGTLVLYKPMAILISFVGNLISTTETGDCQTHHGILPMKNKWSWEFSNNHMDFYKPELGTDHDSPSSAWGCHQEMCFCRANMGMLRVFLWYLDSQRCGCGGFHKWG